jgi:hypothetical protein
MPGVVELVPPTLQWSAPLLLSVSVAITSFKRSSQQFIHFSEQTEHIYFLSHTFFPLIYSSTATTGLRSPHEELMPGQTFFPSLVLFPIAFHAAVYI